MNIDKAFPSKYLKVADLDEQDLTLTIKGVTIEEVGQGAEAEQKPIIYFEEEKKGLALNKTNATIIKTLYGNDTDAWIGKRITLWPNPEVPYGNKIVPAIRIRSKAPTPTPVADPFLAAMKSIQNRISPAKFFVELSTLGFDLPEDVPADKRGVVLEQMTNAANMIEAARKAAV